MLLVRFPAQKFAKIRIILGSSLTPGTVALFIGPAVRPLAWPRPPPRLTRNKTPKGLKFSSDLAALRLT